MSPEEALLGFVRRHLTFRAESAPPLVIGLCGAQGSGKSTLASRISESVPGTVILSLDDLYLTRDERQRLAVEIHPLFATRGVPGTHDIALGHAVLDALAAGRETSLPRFDKARDERTPPVDWPTANAARLVIFEGWCVGASPLEPSSLERPLNMLERNADVDGTWRRAWNDALAGAYQTLFARLDQLVLLAAPSWDAVLSWRIEQEQALRVSGRKGPGLMTDAEVARFVSHYERLTRHLLAEMPRRAGLTLSLGLDRSLTRMDVRL